MTKVYRAITENGYAEFFTQKEAKACSDNIEVVELIDNTELVAETVVRQKILQEIIILENEITDRRRDEYILGEDTAWLPAQRARIALERNKLGK